MLEVSEHSTLLNTVKDYMRYMLP